MKTPGKLIIMAIATLTLASCTGEGARVGGSILGKKKQNPEPITKPEIQIPDRRMTAEALWAMGRIGGAIVDSEGHIAYTVSYYSVPENRSTTWIRICSPDMELLDEFVGSSPAWLDKGALAYIREGELHIRQRGKDHDIDGDEAQLCDIEGFLISPTHDHIVTIRTVPTRPTTAEQYPDLDKATGRVYDNLMYKHWDEWVESAPQPFIHDFKLEYEGDYLSEVEIGEGSNILADTTYECPMRPFGGVEQLAWSRDGHELAYTCRKKTGIDYALSTNSDIYLLPVQTDDKQTAEQNLTADNSGYDTNPAYSPNGQWIAWQSMERDGYESDENRLMVCNRLTGEKRWLTRGMETNVDQFRWLNDTTILFTAVWHGTVQLYSVTLSGQRHQLTSGQHDLELCDIHGNDIYLLKHSMQQANELYRIENPKSKIESGENAECQLVQLTFENKNIYDQVEMGRVEPIWQKTSDGKQMLTWIIYPPQFDPSKKYPTLLYCEGGPQSPVSQFWSYRWNFMMMSAHDYIVVAPNRRGLPGFGNEWNEQISGDYGGQCMRDLLSAIDQFAKQPYVDTQHLGCVGASFGGYSVYWLAGHHNHRFSAFIAHDGIFNLEMQYLETEEKWFANWDMGGAYWDKNNKVAQRTFANSPHRFVDKWDTPILCIHGEKDYRILANQAMAAFDAARMRNIPAEMLIFPDENHWVLQPQNGILWQRTFFNWLDRWLKNKE